MADRCVSPGTTQLFFDLLTSPGLYTEEQQTEVHEILTAAGGIEQLQHSDVAPAVDKMKKKQMKRFLQSRKNNAT